MTQRAAPIEDWLQDKVQDRGEPLLQVQQGLLQARAAYHYGRPGTSLARDASSASTSSRSDQRNTSSANELRSTHQSASSRTSNPSVGPTEGHTKSPDLLIQGNAPPRYTVDQSIPQASVVGGSSSGGRENRIRHDNSRARQTSLNDRLIDSRQPQDTPSAFPPQRSSALPSSSHIVVSRSGSKHPRADEISSRSATAVDRHGKRPKLSGPSIDLGETSASFGVQQTREFQTVQFDEGARDQLLAAAFRLTVESCGPFSNIVLLGDYMRALMIWTGMSQQYIENDFRRRYAELNNRFAAPSLPSRTSDGEPVEMAASADYEQQERDQVAALSLPSDANIGQAVVTAPSADDEQQERDLLDAEAFSRKHEASRCTTRVLNHGKRYSCPDCGAGVNQFSDYHRHCESRWPRVFHRCRHCDNIYSRHINEHCRTSHDEHHSTASYIIEYDPPWQGSCNICHAVFRGPRLDSTTAMLRHVWDVHVTGRVVSVQSCTVPTGRTDDDFDEGHHGGDGGSFHDGKPGSSFNYNHSQTSAKSGDSGQVYGPSGQHTLTDNYQSIKHAVKRWLLDRGRSIFRQTSDARSPRSEIASRGVPFHDDENFKLDLDIFGMVGIGAAAEYHDDAELDDYLARRTVSFDVDPKAAVARAATVRSDAPSNSTASRSSTMRSEGSSTVVNDWGHETNDSSVGSSDDDDDDDDDDDEFHDCQLYSLRSDELQQLQQEVKRNVEEAEDGDEANEAEHEEKKGAEEEEEEGEKESPKIKSPSPTRTLDERPDLGVVGPMHRLRINEASLDSRRAF